jgi:hypothetical protein
MNLTEFYVAFAFSITGIHSLIRVGPIMHNVEKIVETDSLIVYKIIMDDTVMVIERYKNPEWKDRLTIGGLKYTDERLTVDIPKP